MIGLNPLYARKASVCKHWGCPYHVISLKIPLCSDQKYTLYPVLGLHSTSFMLAANFVLNQQLHGTVCLLHLPETNHVFFLTYLTYFPLSCYYSNEWNLYLLQLSAIFSPLWLKVILPKCLIQCRLVIWALSVQPENYRKLRTAQACYNLNRAKLL